MTFKEKYKELSRSGLSMNDWVYEFGKYIWENAVSVRVVSEDDEGNEIEVDCAYMRVNFEDLGENVRLEYDDELNSEEN